MHLLPPALYLALHLVRSALCLQAVYNRSGSLLGTLGSSWEEEPAPLPVAEAEGQAGALPCSTMDPADWGPECLAESAAIALGGGTAAGMLGIGGMCKRCAEWGAIVLQIWACWLRHAGTELCRGGFFPALRLHMCGSYVANLPLLHTLLAGGMIVGPLMLGKSQVA